MKISELYDRYVEMLKVESRDKEAISEEDVYKWLDKQVVRNHFPSMAMIDVIRSINENSSKQIGEYKYMDKSAQFIGLEISLITIFTNLRFEGVEQGKMTEDTMKDYDYAKQMRLIGFLKTYQNPEVSLFLKLCECENETYDKENSISAIISTRLNTFINRANSLLDILVEYAENFDPSQIQEAKTILESMNENVKAISDLKL